MPKPFPKEFRDDVVRVAQQRDPDLTLAQIAKDFGVHVGTLEESSSTAHHSIRGAWSSSPKLGRCGARAFSTRRIRSSSSVEGRSRAGSMAYMPPCKTSTVKPWRWITRSTIVASGNRSPRWHRGSSAARTPGVSTTVIVESANRTSVGNIVTSMVGWRGRLPR
ncbi:hypothetical protein [Kocuria salsicia]|uniref:hypothetical protein n=1 Tax=Kocuria salsicia TaxID=664639 RepID=UPI0016436FA8|nr:hypothetical protein [Kocuria salsicia]